MSRRCASFLVVKIRAERVRFAFPFYIPLLYLFRPLVPHIVKRINPELPAQPELSAQARGLLRELRSFGRFQLVDVDAQDENDKVVVKVSLW